MAVKYSINQIIADNAAEYLKKYPKTTSQQRKVIRNLSQCRTEQLGFRLYKCDHCGSQELINNSCRNRHCPQCQNMKKEKWIIERKAEVLPFTYFHIVFTLPSELSQIVYKNKKAMYALLFDAAKETLLSTVTKEKYLGAEMGFFAVLHTWGQKLNFHPHLHCVVPGGGFIKEKGTWVHAKKNFLVPAAVLKSNFRRLFLSGLKKLFMTGMLNVSGLRWDKNESFQELIDLLFKKNWVVYLKESFNSSASVIKYLARYTHKIAITSHRILSYQNGRVRFTYRDYQDKNKIKQLEMSAIQFMRMFLMHTLPHKFVRIRYYGYLSHRNKRKFIDGCLKFYNMDALPKKFPENWQELYRELTNRDLTICPRCKQGHLILACYNNLTGRMAPPNPVVPL